MRIGLLIYDLRSGGAERVLCKWSDILSENNEVFIYNYDDSEAPAYSYSGIRKILHAPGGGKNPLGKIVTVLKRFFLLRKQLKKDRIDILISFCSTANFTAFLQCIPRIASIRVFSEYGAYRRFYRFLIRHTRTRLLVQTERLRQFILDDVGERYADKIYVLANPVDTESIVKKAQEQPEERFLKMIKGRRVICFTASFKAQKNHWNLIKSFKLLHDKHPEVMLLLIGGNGEMEAGIRKMVSDAHLENDVVFFGKTQNPFCCERASDLFVLPSLNEGIPNALIEALIVGVPVVSTDCPSGPREILYRDPDIMQRTTDIEYADFGILVSEFDEAPDLNCDNITEQNIFLCKAMERMLFDADISLRYKKAALSVRQRFNMSAYAEDLGNIVLDTVKKADG